MTHCEGLGGNRPTVRLQRHIHDHGDGKKSFAGSIVIKANVDD
jgi:hypothetical protein